MEQIFSAMANNWMWTVMGAIAITAIGLGSIKGILVSFARERTRREIAAYIAEGTMTPDQGERLLKAAPKEDDCC